MQKRKRRARTRQRVLEDFMYRPGWQPITNHKHGADIMLMYREAGGGGDCMFHSIAAALDNGCDFRAIRDMAAGLVTEENAPDILMDMAAQCPKTVGDPMDVAGGPQGGPMGGTFKPELAWNEARGSRAAMAQSLKAAIATRGNFLWGDATVAALLEDGLGMNILLLAVDSGVELPLTGRETLMAHTIYARWVDSVLAQHPELMEATNEAIIEFLARCGCTMQRAQRTARDMLGGGAQWLCARRQPVGTTRELCTNMDSGDLRRKGYSADRPTILIWNRGNIHWVPVAVGPTAATVIAADSPLRPMVDSLLK